MNSVLNPEAPEFYPHLTSMTQEKLYNKNLQRGCQTNSQDGYTTVKKTIKCSNQFPFGTSFTMFKTFTDFNVATYKLSKNVLIQTNDIITTPPSTKLKLLYDGYNMDKIMDVNQDWLDRVNVNINSVIKPESSEQTVSSNQPVITKTKVRSTMFIGAKNIPRPQLKFKDTIDNTENLWVPRISDKPNNIKPLALNIIYNDEGEAVGYEHPYKVELKLYEPLQHFIEPDPHPPTFPPPLEQTKLIFIETEEQMDELVLHLETVEEFAVDVEHHSYRSYQGIICLIQISTIEGDFIIDALAVREHIHKLNMYFTDPKKLKIFHGAKMDVLWLQRDFGVYVVAMFDTHQAARALNLSGLSLKSLLLRYCSVNTDKRYQLADWRIRPLPDELIQYARMDTHYLLYIWRRMKGELLNMGEHILMSVFDQSRYICGTTYKKELVTDRSHLSLYMKSKKKFNSRQMAALRLLYKWRDLQARELDESTTYLLPNHMILSLAEEMPRDVQGVAACCSPASPFLKRNLITVHRMLLCCRELPLEPQLYPMPPTAVKVHQRVLSYNIHDMTHFPENSDDNETPKPALLKTESVVTPDVPVFKMHDGTIVSDFNVDTKEFIPPYYRYRKYRSLAQVEEVKEYKKKEAKIAALSKGNELIKTEVLLKLQETTALKEKDEQHKEVNENITKIKKDQKKLTELTVRSSSPETTQSQLKRKISNDKLKKAENKNKTQNKYEQVHPKSYNYKNLNYKKFRDEDKAYKQPKMMFNKRN